MSNLVSQSFERTDLYSNSDLNLSQNLNQTLISD
jgi:hypothetical protein